MPFYTFKSLTQQKVHLILWFLLVFASFHKVFGQIQASFTISKENGCRPLTVQFTNTTTGAGQDVVYNWNLGNGNTSALQNPGATYLEEKTYTVTLTVTSGGSTSTATRQVIVNKTPTVDFTATPTAGCMPLDVSFQANGTPGDGTIIRYFWDFGDGKTEESPTLSAPKHTYTRAQQAPVSLTVTNSFGCFNTKTYSGLVDVYQDAKADFVINPVRTCSLTDTVHFQNKSQAPPGSKWLWEFGNGKTSTEQSPKHLFMAEGNYLVKLTVTTANGCTSTKISDTLRIGNIQLDFNLPESVCQNSRLELYHKINPPYRSIIWNANMAYLSSNFNSPYAVFIPFDTGKAQISLEVDYGNCKVKRTKEIIIHPIIHPGSFSKKKLNYCTLPAAYEFADTTQIGAKWLWTISPSDQVLGTEKTFRHEFKDSSGYGTINLEVTTDKGCTSKILDTVFYSFYDYKITVDNALSFNESATCTGVSHSFGLFSPLDGERRSVSVKWDFGDGTTSTEKAPTHAFTIGGEFQVKANYVTEAGCSGVAYFPIKIPVIERPKVWIEVEGGSTICGNTPTKIFIRSDRGFSFEKTEFDKDGILMDIYPSAGNVYKFFELGNYNATVYAFWGSYCRDTIRFEKAITVIPPLNFPMAPINTCDGDRLTVEFKDSSVQAEKWRWDFGDGNFQEFNSKPETVKHRYEKTGAYIAKLTTKSGNCSVTDSIRVYVWKKQHPVLSFSSEKVCTDVVTPYTLNGYERNPAPYPYTERFDFSSIIGQYADTSFRLNEFSWIGIGALYGMDPGQKGFRFLLKTSYFECDDTTNFANIEFRGPIANFETPREAGYCLSDSVILADSSKALPGAPIIKWTWETSEGSFNFTNGFRYLFNWSSDRGIGLIVEDTEGCTSFKGNQLRVYGPKSSFTASSQNVALGTTVQFTNNTAYYPDYALPNWILPDGRISNNNNESFTFNEEGEYYVKLFHELTARGCKDTMVRKIIVRKVTAQFTHSISYINNNGCPPALVSFTSTASNAVRYAWNFGNGATAGNQTQVSHTYNQPGVYTVWHYTWDENNNVDSSFDIIEIEGPYALISANRTFSCNNLEVILNADVKNATSFTWDFGDGTLSSTAATTMNHRYLTAGIYTPSLVLKDNEGCQATSQLAQPLIVDSLRADFSYLPTGICAGGQVQFTSASRSFSGTRLGTPMQYQWSINRNNLTPGSDSTLAHAFAGEGNYTVRLQVQTAYGCSASATKTLTVQPPLQVSASGPTSLCIGDSATFTASSVGANVQYRWYLPGRNVITGNTTPRLAMLQTGSFTGWLAASNSACTDSVSFAYTVHGLPQVTIAPSTPRICLGDTLALTVNSNASLQWNPSSTLVPTTNGARVWPTADTRYRVQAVSQQGCTHADSVVVQVVQPFSIQVSPDVPICTGASATLTATGATAYQWSPAVGLSQPNSANTIATPTATTRYTLTGSDAFGCFTDTASVLVTVNPLPQITNIADKEVQGGESIEVLATANLPNVQWVWNPGNYLSCANCPNPTIRPLHDIAYTVTATTTAGCKASVSFEVKVLCSKERIYIPNAFTPNGDGLNDRFTLLGGGATMVRYLRITDRWGNTIFERKMVPFGSLQASWDGNYPNGLVAPSGNYLFVAELECGSGETFRFDGGVRLLR